MSFYRNVFETVQITTHRLSDKSSKQILNPYTKLVSREQNHSFQTDDSQTL